MGTHVIIAQTTMAAALPSTMKAVVNQRQGLNLVYGVVDIPTPTVQGATDLIVKMTASPVNPSDLGSVGMVARFGGDAVVGGESPSTVSAPLPEPMPGMFAADGATLPVGSEGFGVVVAAGDSPEAQALIGKKVACCAGGAYAQYAKTTTDSPMFAVLPDDSTGAEGASLFVNPLTVVGFVHTMREEGHKAIVHTAAASNVGRMLVKHCKEEGIQLVNIVRKEEGVAALKALGAEFVVNSSAPTFKEDLLAAVLATGATIAFDATGGGTLAMDILNAFEQSLRQLYPDTVQGWYGPPQNRAVYKYGGLDKSNSEFLPSVGVGNWPWGGWLMPFHYMKFPASHRAEGIAKAVAGMTTTFSTNFGARLSLEDLAESPEKYKATLASTTDEKFLVMP